MTLSVIIPAYDEEGAIASQIESVRAVLSRIPVTSEILVVDDGSTDRTAARAAATGVRVIAMGENRGYGAALKAGIHSAAGQWVLITDADGTYPADAIPRLWERACSCEMVVASRTGAVVHIPSSRKLAKWIIRRWACLLARQRIPDLNSGMRLMRKTTVRQFEHLLPDGFSFTSTITMAMLCNGLNVEYVPIDYLQRVGKSKIRPTDFFRFLRQVTRTALTCRRRSAPETVSGGAEPV